MTGASSSQVQGQHRDSHDKKHEENRECHSDVVSSVSHADILARNDRQRRYRQRKRRGLVRVTVWADRLWLADMLYQVGELDSADTDDTPSLQAAHQRLVDWLLEEAKEERAGRVTRNDPR
jgi:hypothetical protein